MINSFYGFKQQQQQVFDKKGNRLVVTKIKALPLKVKRLKTEKKDGYYALQVEIKKAKKTILREVKLKKPAEIKIGAEIKLNQVFQPGDKLNIRGITKGKGFAGVMKRWGFKGGPRTHGQSDRQRAPGSIGQGTDPGRVWKGKKMPGHMGNKAKTIKNLKVFKIDEEKNELWITGVIPGGKRGLVKITKLN